ncbi:uncharacterized protein DFL_007651 [Arthrobotrys flagrans]|uniref:Uncharacterized protein n=1 Tax=Arthrobotrys flagrans TaxID=97331 RepID=A0A436ZWY7_ARTFL|nr:hypothetical protein DFL_007651 [Arthrobotrys flagrans]
MTIETSNVVGVVGVAGAKAKTGELSTGPLSSSGAVSDGEDEASDSFDVVPSIPVGLVDQISLVWATRDGLRVVSYARDKIHHKFARIKIDRGDPWFGLGDTVPGTQAQRTDQRVAQQKAYISGILRAQETTLRQTRPGTPDHDLYFYPSSSSPKPLQTADDLAALRGSLASPGQRPYASSDSCCSSWSNSSFTAQSVCLSASDGARQHMDCLLLNTGNLDGIRNHIKTHHPDVFFETLPCTSWHQIFDVCFPRAQPEFYPSPYFNLQLVREKFKKYWSSKSDLVRPSSSRADGEAFSESVPLDINIEKQDGPPLGFRSTKDHEPGSKDAPEIISSFQAILHIWLSLHLESNCDSQPFDLGNHKICKPPQGGSGGNGQPYVASPNGGPNFQLGFFGGNDGQGGLEEDGIEESDDEDDDGSDGGGRGRTRDAKYAMPHKCRIGCPLQQLGLPDLPCPGHGRGRKFTGASKLSYIRQHIKGNHRDIWTDAQLDSIAHPKARTWRQIFLKLFPHWPRSLGFPPKWFRHTDPESSMTLYRRLESSPGFATKLNELYGAVERDTLWSRALPDPPHSYMDNETQSLDIGHRVGLELNGQNYGADPSFVVGEMARDVSHPMPETSSGPQQDHSGPDFQDVTFPNHQLEPDWEETIPQYLPLTIPQSHSLQTHQQQDLEPSNGLPFLSPQPPYSQPAPAPYWPQSPPQPNQGHQFSGYMNSFHSGSFSHGEGFPHGERHNYGRRCPYGFSSSTLTNPGRQLSLSELQALAASFGGTFPHVPTPQGHGFY